MWELAWVFLEFCCPLLYYMVLLLLSEPWKVTCVPCNKFQHFLIMAQVHFWSLLLSYSMVFVSSFFLTWRLFLCKKTTFSFVQDVLMLFHAQFSYLNPSLCLRSSFPTDCQEVLQSESHSFLHCLGLSTDQKQWFWQAVAGLK